jgi:Rod binding domain-containing protein
MSSFSVSDLDLGQFAAQVRSASRTNELDPPTGGMTREQLHKIAGAFEQILTGMMVEQMRKTIPEGGLLPEMPGHDLYEQMLDQEFVRRAGENGLRLGVAEAIERQFAEHVQNHDSALSEQDQGTDAVTLYERRKAGL